VVSLGLTIFYSLLSRELIYRHSSPAGLRIIDLQNEDGIVYSIAQSDYITQFQADNNGRLILSLRFTLKQLKNSSQKNGVLNLVTPSGPISVNTSALISDNFSEDTVVWLYLYYSETVPGNFRILALYQSPGEQILGGFARILIISSASTLVLAGILGFFLIRKFLKPVRWIKETAQAINDKNLSDRLNVDSNDELGQLAATLNGMFGRLQQAFDRERQFTTDVSHELRAPLAVAQGEASFALRKERAPEEYQVALETISREIDQLSFLINHLLFLARSDGVMVTEDVDLKPLLEELLEDAEVLCEQKKIALESELDETALIRGDITLLREMFLNLIDNAVRYTPPNGRIKISLSVRDSFSHTSVRDSGIGIPQEHLPYIFNSFYRVDKSRSREDGGAGLGLAICKRIAELHGGKISVTSKVGAGSTFTVEIPLKSSVKRKRK
jgi:heavy metal sensor kinase